MRNHSFFILLLLFHVQCKTLKFIRIFLWIFSIIFQTCLLQAYIKTPSRIVYIYICIDICLRYSIRNHSALPIHKSKRFRKIILHHGNNKKFRHKIYLKPRKILLSPQLPSHIYVPAKKIYWRAAMKHLPRITYPTC